MNTTALGCAFARPTDDCYNPCGGAMLFGDDFSYVDIDSEPRPTEPGPEYAGADVPP